MPQLTLKLGLLVAFPVIIAITAVAWQTKKSPATAGRENTQDTVPSKNRHKIIRDKNYGEAKDIDEEIQRLDEALKNVDGKLDPINWENIEKQVQTAMEKAKADIDRQHIDMEKVQQEIDAAMKNIDFEKIQQETHKAMQHLEENIDFKKMQADIDMSLAKEKEYVNSDAFRKEIEAAKKIDMGQVRKSVDEAMEEMKKNKIDLKEEMANVKQEMQNAKEELVGFREMLDKMEKDGLIDTKGDYNIEYDNHELYINHVKQSQEITVKYKGYFKKEGTRIYKKSGRFNINID